MSSGKAGSSRMSGMEADSPPTAPAVAAIARQIENKTFSGLAFHFVEAMSCRGLSAPAGGAMLKARGAARTECEAAARPMEGARRPNPRRPAMDAGRE